MVTGEGRSFIFHVLLIPKLPFRVAPLMCCNSDQKPRPETDHYCSSGIIMKLHTTTVAVLLGQLSSLATVAQAAQKKIEIPAGGYTFKLSLFDDGRTTPYRVFFADEYLTGSSYRLSADGHVQYFKAGAELYFDRMVQDDHSITFSKKQSESRKHGKGRPEPHDDYDFSSSEAIFCTECTEAIVATCYSGLPEFCTMVDRSILGYDGLQSMRALCHNYEEVCTIVEDSCHYLCGGKFTVWSLESNCTNWCLPVSTNWELRNTNSGEIDVWICREKDRSEHLGIWSREDTAPPVMVTRPHNLVAIKL